MDVVELLFLLLLFLFPLLEGLLSRRKPKPAPPPPDPEAEAELARAEAEVRAQRPPLRVEPVGGWGEWTVRLPAEEGREEVEALAAEEVLDEEEAARLLARQERMDEALHPEVVRVSAPVVSLESLEGDLRPARRRLPRAAAEPLRPRAAAPATPLAAALRGRSDLRRAVLLSEVLGAPRALRELEERTG